MRVQIHTVLRPLVIIVAVSAPLAQVALANVGEPDFLVHHHAATSSSNGGPYSDDLRMSPPVGD